MPNEPTPVAPVEDVAAPNKVEFDEAQKQRVSQIVAEAARHAGAESRSEAERLRKELDALKRTQVPAENLELEATKAELSALRAERQEHNLQQSLRAALSQAKEVGEEFIDPELAASILRTGVKLVDGKVTLVDQEGNARLNSSLEPMTLQEAAVELAVKKPFLVKANIHWGTGAHETKMFPDTRPKVEHLFGPGSDAAAVNRLAIRNPQEYRRLRQEAVKKGLVNARTI